MIVIAKEHEPDKEQGDSFSEMTLEMFSDVHSGTVEEGKDQIRQFWEEQRGTIGYYLSTLEEEERTAVVASAENHTVQKVVCDGFVPYRQVFFVCTDYWNCV